MARVYNFPLPARLTGYAVSVGINDLKMSNLWDQVPAPAQIKLQNAASSANNITIFTKADIDSLPDNIWNYLAQKLNLSWSDA